VRIGEIADARNGLESFSGTGGVAHTYAYADADRFRGLRVLVAGGAISALEIASDLAMAGAERVTVSVRRQRYVLPKLAAGTPTDHIVFTRFHALAEEVFTAGRVNQMYTDAALRLGGRPEYYGAPAASATVAEAGITLCQHFLPLVAEGRIDVRPWITGVDGRMVRFSDGRADEFDAILGRIQAAGIPYRSSVRGPVDGAINTDYGGRMFYWNDPEGHQWELLTVSYARQPR